MSFSIYLLGLGEYNKP